MPAPSSNSAVVVKLSALESQIRPTWRLVFAAVLEYLRPKTSPSAVGKPRASIESVLDVEVAMHALGVVP